MQAEKRVKRLEIVEAEAVEMNSTVLSKSNCQKRERKAER